MSFPKWLKEAIKLRVVTLAEAQEIHQISLGSDEEYITLPEHLWDAAERINLWESPVEGSVQ